VEKSEVKPDVIYDSLYDIGCNIRKLGK